MRTKRKWLLALLLALLAIIILLLVHPDTKRWVSSSRLERDGAQVTRSGPPRTPAPSHSPPSYVLRKDLPAGLKKQALTSDLALRGRVMNTRGDGIPGARVEIALDEQRALILPPPAIAEAETNAQGYYQFGLQPVAAFAELRAEKEGYSPGCLSLDLQGETGMMEKNLILLETVATLSGRILDGQGEAVPNAKVLFGCETRPEMKYTATYKIVLSGKGGDYFLADLPAGPGTLAVRVPGYEIKSSRMELQPGHNEVDVQVEGKPTFYISVKNRRGEPVKFPRAFLAGGKLTDQVGFGDESGLIDVPLTAQVTSFDWEVGAGGYRPAPVTGNPKGGRAVVILEDGPVISGLVVSDTGRPIPQALVFAGCPDGGSDTRADSDGRFSMNVDCTKELFLETSHPGYINRTVRFAEAPKREVIIKLQEPEGGISGRVLHRDGHPVTRFHIEVRGNPNTDEPFFTFRTFCDPDGRFAILDLPAGQLEVRIVASEVSDRQNPVIELENLRLNIPKGMVYTDLVVRLKVRERPARQE